MHRFIVISFRSVTAEYSRSTWRPIVPDDATIGGHCCDLFMICLNLIHPKSSHR